MAAGHFSRRAFLGVCAAVPVSGAEPIIDIHQHTNYLKRSDEDLVRHQREMGVSRTVLLPAGSRYGLAAEAFGNDSVVALARRHPKEFVFFANELPDLPEARAVIEKYLKMGAIGIGEQKFPVDSDSQWITRIAEIARDYEVPVLLHFEHERYNLHFERFYRVLDKFPSVNFIGHAQTWWGNIDRNHTQADMYPKSRVAPGGLTDRWLADYGNLYGDLSANSGLNSLLRDEENARAFLQRHQDKLMFGSDCPDTLANGEKCLGGKQIAALRKLSPDQGALRKILHGNAVQVLRLG
jgi:uncharacterized protein